MNTIFLHVFANENNVFLVALIDLVSGTCGLVAMTSASHAEGRQFDPGQVYLKLPHFRYHAQIRSILANDTPQNSPPFLGQFDPKSVRPWLFGLGFLPHLIN